MNGAIGPHFLRLMEDRVRIFAREKDLWRPGHKLALAVSGGADSLCMLHIMAKIAERDQLSLVVAHLHHGIRPAEGDADEAFVRANAEQLGLRFISERAEVPALAQSRRLGLEEAGRIARREFLDRVLNETGALAVATAHTRSDHVETILLHLFRGAGLRGLTGIPPHGFDSRIRPLLCLTREETRRFCATAGLKPRHDPGNDDLSFQRNRIRQRILPLLREEINPALDDAMDRLSQIVSDALELLDASGERLVDAARGPAPHLYLRAPLRAAPRAAAADAIRLILETNCPSAQALGFRETRAILAILQSVGEAALSSGCVVEVSGSFLRIRRQKDTNAPHSAALASASRHPKGAWRSTFEAPLPVPGQVRLPAGTVITARLTRFEDNEYDGTAGPDDCGVTVTQFRGPLMVRHPRPGDRLTPAGRGGSCKLKQIFSEKRIPVWDRSTWPVIVDDAGILWVPGLAMDIRAAPVENQSEGDCVRLEWNR